MNAAQQQSAVPNEPHRILLVEDSDSDALLFQRALGRLPGFEIAARVSDGNAAIAYLKGEGEFSDRKRFPFPAIMILDLKLPNSDGFEVLQWTHRRSPRPVVAVFTSIDGEPTRRRAEQLGADLYENKTWDATVFDRFIHFVGQIARTRDSGQI